MFPAGTVQDCMQTKRKMVNKARGKAPYQVEWAITAEGSGTDMGRLEALLLRMSPLMINCHTAMVDNQVTMWGKSRVTFDVAERALRVGGSAPLPHAFLLHSRVETFMVYTVLASVGACTPGMRLALTVCERVGLNMDPVLLSGMFAVGPQLPWNLECIHVTSGGGGHKRARVMMKEEVPAAAPPPPMHFEFPEEVAGWTLDDLWANEDLDAFDVVLPQHADPFDFPMPADFDFPMPADFDFPMPADFDFPMPADFDFPFLMPDDLPLTFDV